MTSLAWPLLIVAALFLAIGVYFIVGRNFVAGSAKASREQVNRTRPKTRQLPPSGVTPRRVAGGGIALAVIGVLWVGLFLLSLPR